MTILDTTIVQPQNMSFKACKEKFSMLLKHKTEEAMKAIDSVHNIAKKYVTNNAKTFSSKATEASKIGLAGIFAGAFCVIFALFYMVTYYANRRE